MLAPIPQITGSVPQGADDTFMSTPEFDTLSTAAYHTERVLARRLSVKLGLTPAAALAEVLTQSAGAQGLAALLEQRARAPAMATAARRNIWRYSRCWRRPSHIARRCWWSAETARS